MTARAIALVVNDTAVSVEVGPAVRLVTVLRETLGLVGTKEGCGNGECGACTVLIDDEPRLGCLVLVAEVDGHRVTTIESRGDRRIDDLRRAFVAEGAFQCGFCTPGMIMAASRLPAGADPAEIRAALAGNLCRCTGYQGIVRAVQSALADQ